MSDPAEEVAQMREQIAYLTLLIEGMAGIRKLPAQEWLTVQQVAELSGRHEQTVRHAIKARKLRANQESKWAHYLIHIEDMNSWLRGEIPARQLHAVAHHRAK